MVKYEPILKLYDLIKEARENVEKDKVNDAINLYRKAISDFLSIVINIKAINNITVIDNIFLFYKNLGNIFRNLHDIESITSMNNRLQDLLPDLIGKIPPNKPEVTKSLREESSSFQNYVNEMSILEQTTLRGVYERAVSMIPRPIPGVSPQRTVTEEEKSTIFESSGKLEKALTEIEKLVVLKVKKKLK